MGLAQRLYEGVEVGEDGLVGLITYMRTDSTRISDDARRRGARATSASVRRARSCPPSRSSTRRKKGAQDAHEAIRPTSLKYDPETVRSAVGRRQGRRPRRARDARICCKLYTLIWNRFVACQMVPAVFDQTAIDIAAGRVELRASGQVMKFPGFLAVYAETVEDAANEDETGARAARGATRARRCKLLETRSPSSTSRSRRRGSRRRRWSRSWRRRGSGGRRPTRRSCRRSRTAATSRRRKARLHPTELGVMVNGLLVKSFPDIVSTDFTAQMEEQLDQVEEGKADWVKLLEGFYEPFKLDLEKAKIEMRDLKREEQPTDEVCEKCGKPMVIKWGRNGHFLACSGYPECRNTKEFTRNADGSLTVVPTTRPSDQVCPTCGSPMVIKRGRFGEFLACSRYPECKTTSPHLAGRRLPEAGVRRLPDREALAPRQGVLRLLELLEDPVRLRVVGSPAAPALPEVRRQVRRAEGQQGRHAHPLHQRRAATTPPTPRRPRPRRRRRPRPRR